MIPYVFMGAGAQKSVISWTNKVRISGISLGLSFLDISLSSWAQDAHWFQNHQQIGKRHLNQNHRNQNVIFDEILSLAVPEIILSTSGAVVKISLKSDGILF